jgi:predicted 2-oxoglutarate/Fe(II)-dependent dioxygenase YbiX
VVLDARVYCHHGLLAPAACRRIRAAMDLAASAAAEVLGDGVTLDLDARRALDVEVDEEIVVLLERALEVERAAIADFFGVTLGEREGPGFLRYGPGGFYGPHRDRGDLPSWPGAARRSVAVVTFLNDDFSGGMLRILDDGEPLEITPREGTLVAFSASTLHEVAVVVAGTRDTVVDWFYERSS